MAEFSNISFYINLKEGTDIDAFHERMEEELGDGMNAAINILSVIECCYHRFRAVSAGEDIVEQQKKGLRHLKGPGLYHRPACPADGGQLSAGGDPLHHSGDSGELSCHQSADGAVPGRNRYREVHLYRARGTDCGVGSRDGAPGLWAGLPDVAADPEDCAGGLAGRGVRTCFKITCEVWSCFIA